MAIYLIDYENVHEKGLTGIEQLKSTDVLCLLYSDAAQSLTIDTMQLLTKSGAEVQYFKCLGSGKNYLDFQLSTVLGLMAGSRGDNEFVIISGDKGFQSLVDFWDGQTYLGRCFRCRLQATIDGKSVAAKAVKKQAVKKAAGKRSGKNASKAASEEKASSQATQVTIEAEEHTAEEATAQKPKSKTSSRRKSRKSGKTEAHKEIREAQSIDLISVKQEKPAEGVKMQESIAATDHDAGTEKAAAPVKEIKSTLQKNGVTAIAEAARKKVRAAVKNLQLLPKDYTAIYNNFLKASSEAELKNRMMQSIGREQGAQAYEKTLDIYRDLAKK